MIVAEDPATRPPRAVEPPAELFKFPPNRVAVLFALMEQRMLKRALTVVVSVFLWAPLGAQTLGTITGGVKDSSGATIPGRAG